MPHEAIRSAASRPYLPTVTLDTNFEVDWKRLVGYPVRFIDGGDEAMYSLNLLCDAKEDSIVYHDASIDINQVKCADFDPIAFIVATLLPRKESDLKIFKYAKEFHATFSLLVADPDSHPVSWDIDGALSKYIRPFTTGSLAAVTNISLSSQISLYATLPIKPTRVAVDNGTDFFTLRPSQLPHFINSAEWNLGLFHLSDK
jgi:hypothetical protein